MTYSLECQLGRDHAARIMQEVAQSGNLPKLLLEMRDAAKDETGYGVGFLTQIAESVK